MKKGHGPFSNKNSFPNLHKESGDIEGLIRILKEDVSPQIKKEAIEALVSLGDPQSSRALKEIINKGRSELSEYVLQLLPRYCGPHMLDILAAAIRSKDEAWSMWVLNEVATRGEPEALHFLLRAATEGSPTVRRGAARLLWRALEDDGKRSLLTESDMESLSEGLMNLQEDPLVLLRMVAALRDERTIHHFLKGQYAPQIKREAVMLLTRLGTTEAFRLLRKWMATAERELAEYALNLLMGVPGDGAVEAIWGGLNHQDPSFRAYVLYHLDRRKEPAAVRALLDAMRDPHPIVSQKAREMIKRCWKVPERLEGLDVKTLDAVFDHFSEDVVTTILSGDYPFALRLASVRWIGGAHTEEHARLLVSIASEKEGEFRTTALAGLESMQSLSTKILTPLIRHADAEVRFRATRMFARHATCRDGALLMDLVRDESPQVRMAALEGMIQLKAPEALEAAIRLSNDKDEQIRYRAIVYLGSRQEPLSHPPLLRAMDDSSPKVAKAAIYAVIFKGIWNSKVQQKALNLLLKGASSAKVPLDELDGLCEIIKMLKRHPTSRALKPLVAAARSTSVRMRRLAAEAIEAHPRSIGLEMWAQLTDTDDKNILKKVALALGEARDPRGVIPLIRAMDECGGRVGDRAMELLKEQADIHDLDFLIQSLKAKWPSVKVFVAKRMEELKSPQFMEPLLAAMEDEDVEVQTAVVGALKNFVEHPKVTQRLVKAISLGDISLRQVVIDTFAELAQSGVVIKEAMEPLMRSLGNRFLRKRAEDALKKFGDRRGLLAIKRRYIRDSMIPKPPRPRDLWLMEQEGGQEESPRLLYG
jgi:HEAT repeat protein